MSREWKSPFNPFNSMKALIYGKRFEGILNEDYYPPVVVNLDVTGKCQYRCVWCHHRRKQVKSQTMPDLSDRLAKTFAHFCANWQRDGEKVLACCIVGSQGDALLYPHLPRLLKDLHNNNIDVGLVSNGYGFTDKMIDYAVHYTKFIGFSMDSATRKTYQAVHQPPQDGWERVLDNMRKITKRIRDNGLRNDVGYKFLIFPQNQTEVYEACRLAKLLGCRYIQIRPADLPEEARAEINVADVDGQIQAAIDEFDEPGVFEVAGIRHKFSPDLKKLLPAYCYMTALTVTITSDGRAWPCVDRRCDEPTMLADCGKYGWQALKGVWGSAEHIRIIHEVINRCGKGPECNIRCSNYGYDVLFRDVFTPQDAMDRRLI